MAAEIPAVFLFAFLVDKKEAGRIRMTFLGFAVTALIWIIIYFGREPTIASCTIISRFTQRIVYIGLNVLEAESYPTAFRSLGVGSGQASGKLFGALAPFIYFPIYYADPYLPFLLSAIFCIAGAIITAFHPVDLT